MSFNPDNIVLPGANIKVVGVGGGGGNAVSTMIRAGVDGVQFITLNTDIQALRYSLSPVKIQVGKELTKGLGAGADPDIGRDAALEDRHEIQAALEGADMVFVTAGMGGGTGTGGTSIVAQIARELGALTVGVVTKPFDFEGRRRKKYAEMGIARLRESVDTLITIPNQRLLQIATPDLSMINAFRMADEVLVNAVKGISDIINIPGTINVDFADVKTVMSGMGLALMGIGTARGEGRAKEAAFKAISSPLLEDVDIEGATGILINITAGSQVTLMEVNEACNIIQDAAHEDANIIFGAVIDENVGDEIRVTVIATGFPSEYEDQANMNKTPKSSAYFHETSTMITGSRPLIKTPYSNVSKPLTTSKPYIPVINTPITTPKIGASAFDGLAPSFTQQPPVQEPVAFAPTVVSSDEPINQAPTPIPVEPSVTEEIENDNVQELTRLTIEDAANENEPIAPVEFHEEEFKFFDETEEEQASFIEENHFDREPDAVEQHFEEQNNFAMEEPAAFIEENHFDREAQAIDQHFEEESIPSFDIPMEEVTSEEAIEPQLMVEHFENTSETHNEFEGENFFDQKIDEALELAERLQNDIRENFDEENLDVPAFLRNDIRDISLD